MYVVLRQNVITCRHHSTALYREGNLHLFYLFYSHRTSKAFHWGKEHLISFDLLSKLIHMPQGCNCFRSSLPRRKDGILLVASYLLDVKKQSLDDYLADFLIPKMPPDEIGIFLFACMMHRHVTVWFNDLWWTTHTDGDSTNVDCILIYHGKCIYVPTVPMSPDEYCHQLLVLWEFSTSQKELLLVSSRSISSLISGVTAVNHGC